ncbi:ferredoxin [Vibrio sp. UCD-FRSSP16_10]|uniref:2Fe-2S iron-sulfur cluster-binding protein n=1 Tax=unclassified Vibrio TaxID=2614977 RepID=UPI000802034E|nr:MULTISPECIES: 2Fe-2S iron-sulfur cluster-binding protein [unclassified Vibrio]OBT12920.1 ferredoxin [Vibrio sp. UCD-FRSSP16_30]OBT18383.1 ferredoxin [Vibrio sp. UCD-FRSSP16_10]
MRYKVEILPSGVIFEVNEQQTILDAALAQQIAFPNRCQVGACGMCLCRLTSGTVTYQLEPMLTEKEQAQGWVFACQAFATTDLVLTFEE